jgi:hypothetical protein
VCISSTRSQRSDAHSYGCQAAEDLTYVSFNLGLQILCARRNPPSRLRSWPAGTRSHNYCRPCVQNVS